MIFPIGDDQVKNGYKPIFSYSFIGLNIIFFLIQLSFDNNLICELGAIPSDIVQGKNLITVFTSMFMHGGWMHLIGNMMFLWVFADNIEANIGNIPFLGFYLLGGIFATIAHIYMGGIDVQATLDCCAPCSMPCDTSISTICAGSIPSVGASGAIAAVMGAYLVMFPKSKIKMLVIYFFRSFKIPALYFLGFWIIQQLFSGYMSIGPVQSSGVAWWAHIGGFVFGVVAGFFARNLVKYD